MHIILTKKFEPLENQGSTISKYTNSTKSSFMYLFIIVLNPIISFSIGKRYLKCDLMLSCYLYYEVILCVNDFEIEIKQLSSMLLFYLRKR